MKSLLGITLATLLVLSGCKKKEETKTDPSKVKFNITSPTDGQTFHDGETMFIRGSIEYPGVIHADEVKVEDTATGSEYGGRGSGGSSGTILVENSFSLNKLKGPTLKMTFTAYLDNSNITATKVMYVNYVP